MISVQMSCITDLFHLISHSVHLLFRQTLFCNSLTVLFDDLLNSSEQRADPFTFAAYVIISSTFAEKERQAINFNAN